MATVRSAVPKNSRRRDTPPQVGVKSMNKIPETLKQTNSQMMEYKFNLKFIKCFKTYSVGQFMACHKKKRLV